MGLCALLFASACKENKETKETKKNYLVTSTIKKDTSITKSYVCQIHSVSHIELRSQEKGFLEKIYVDEGQFVKEGQMLFKIMPKLYQAELEKAQAEANYAAIEYKNTKRLADSNVVAPTEVGMAKAKLDKALAELSLAKVHLQFTEIRAPFDGIIDRFKVRLGSLIDEGALLTTLSDNRQLWVYFNVPEAEYLEYKASSAKDSNMIVNLLMANNKTYDYPGEVKAIEADFDNETGNIAFRATFPNPKGLLRHGETGNILVNVPLKNAIIIPQKATFEIMDKKYVYVIDKEKRVHLRLINIAAEMPDIYVISDGLAENENILLEGVRNVNNNDKISYQFIAPETVLANLKLPTE